MPQHAADAYDPSATRSDSYLPILLRTSANERARGNRDVPGRRASDGALSGCDALALTRQRFVRPTLRRPAPLLSSGVRSSS